MFRSMLLAQGGQLVEREDAQPDGPPAEGGLVWVDLTAPTEADLALLGTRFGFHPLALEDCAHADQRPKHEEYGGYSFIVSQGFDWNGEGEGELRWHELHAFLGPSYLVTVHDEEIPGLAQVWRRVVVDPAPLTRGVDFLYYLILDHCVDNNFPILDRIGDELENLEDAVIEAPTKSCLSRIFTMKGHLSLMRKVLSPQRDVLALLSRRGDTRVSEKTAPYFRDVFDHLVRIVESIDSNRDLLNNALDAYMSSNGQRTNEVMKALAIMSAVFMPLTFITGFFGQNFEHLPFGSDALMYAMIVSCVACPVLLLLWFKSRHWF